MEYFILGLWKVNSTRHIGKEGQNEKYLQTGSEFILFFSTGIHQSELNTIWNIKWALAQTGKKLKETLILM